MNNFDMSILLPTAGAVVLIIGKKTDMQPILLAGILAALLFFMFLTALIRFSKIKSLQDSNAGLSNDIIEMEKSFQSRLAALNAEQEKQKAKLYSEISHSLRMPISVIQGYAELLQSGTLDFAAESEYVDKIVQNTNRINDILSGRLDDNGIEDADDIEANRIELIDLVEQQLADLKSVSEEKGVALQAVYTDDEIFVKADPRQLTRIFANLVENSLKYMGRDGIITILLSKRENMANITVKDDGIGMSADEAEKIFNEGYRGSNSQNAEGSGYGLYMIKQSVIAQNGEISAESSLGQGMKITFTLPLAEENQPVSA